MTTLGFTAGKFWRSFDVRIPEMVLHLFLVTWLPWGCISVIQQPDFLWSKHIFELYIPRALSYIKCNHKFRLPNADV